MDGLVPVGIGVGDRRQVDWLDSFDDRKRNAKGLS